VIRAGDAVATAARPRPAPTPGATAVRDRSPKRLADLVAVLVLGLFSITIVGIHVAAYQVISPIDEESHIDYTLRAPGWQPAVSGQTWLPETIHEEDCRGKDRGGTPKPHCETLPTDPKAFGLDGYTSGYIAPPTYYNVTAVLGRGIQRLFGFSSPVTGFRLVGALWLWAGLAMTYLLGRRLGAARSAAVAAAVLIGASPAVFYSDAIVNPDAASVLVGSFVVWAVLRWDTSVSRRGWLLLVAAGVVSTGVKLQNGIVDLVPAGYLLLLAAWPVGAWLREGRRGRIAWDDLSRRVRGVTVLGVSACAVAVAWSVLVRVNATLPPARNPMALAFTVAKLPAGALSENIGLFMTPLRRAYIPALYATQWLTVTIDVATWLFLAAVVSAAVFGARSREHRALAWPLLLVGVFGAVLMTEANWVVLHQYISGLSQRYSLTLVPVFAVLVAISVRTRLQRRGLVAIAGASGLVTVCVLLGALV
jgi:hypothetical protein